MLKLDKLTPLNMNDLTSFLYRKKILKFNSNKISNWIRTNNSNKLTLALQYGVFDVRIAAIEGLITLKNKKSIPLFEKYINDPVQPVSEAAMKGLENLIDPNNSTISQKIKSKKDYWKNKKADNKKNVSKQHISNLSFSTQEKESPKSRLEKRFKQQKNVNQPPYGF